LLVDEADVHLHYDAQADLIQVLESQDEAAKVIYTTHSAGCLPQDLGRGVRIVVPTYRRDGDRTRETDDSRVVNWFWTDEIEGTGFSPLLIGMGASTFAFSSARRAVIAEGAADAILLPTIIREATRLDRLDYQIAPGLANVDKSTARELDLVAARVVYVLDGDEAGDAKEELLQAAQIPKERILRLGLRRSKIVLEDLIVEDVYLAAVNHELARWHSEAQMPKRAMTDTLRPLAVKTWCASQTPSIPCPGKRAIAQRVLEQAKERSIVAPRRREHIRKLHETITDLLSQPSHAVAT
jgi:predicted ATP-dependent endonuclease of OLD family